MTDLKYLSNEQLAAVVRHVAHCEERFGIKSIKPWADALTEAARRLSIRPRIYDVSKGERPEDGERVLVLPKNSGIVLAGAYRAKDDKVLMFKTSYGTDELDYIIKADDIATWVKG